ncbi:MAG: family 20 glycosylhydrolase [Flavihumibacter sp.]|nr:family 20 glycosylhydrolase [Flavihumibacter sp.]
MKCLLALLLACTIIRLKAQELTIVPQPAEINWPQTSGTNTITSNTPIVLAGSGLENSAHFLNDYLQRFYGFKLNIIKDTNFKNAIVLNYERMDHEIPGAHIVNIYNGGIYIAGDNAEGVFYGVQTLLQLLPPAETKSTAAKIVLPWVNISDYPRFAYRGLHLDVGRHFMPVDFIKKYIDYIAQHKMNYFHWHLTEDQGWRIEIKKYPKLTQVGGYRYGTITGKKPGTGNTNTRHGGFYTQAQVKEIVAYAAKRYVTIIPEIELPGHSSAAIAAYPELSCFPKEPTVIPGGNGSVAGKKAGGKLVQETWGVFEDVFCPTEYTFGFLQDVLDEVMALFPSKYIHIGGDECPKEAWKRSAFCQQLMKEKGLKDEHELQSYFIQRIEKHINKKGRTIIGWDEILEGGLAPNALVMSWRGESGGIEAAKQNHQVIMTPGSHVYFDYAQSENEDSITISGFTPLEKVYAYEPIPAELPADKHHFVLGAQANVWTEYMTNPRKVEYMIFPRLAALSEVLWTPKEKRSWEMFEKKIPFLCLRYYKEKINYSSAFYEITMKVRPDSLQRGVIAEFDNKNLFPITVLRKIETERMQIVKVPDWKKDPSGEKGVLKDSLVNLNAEVLNYVGPILLSKNETIIAHSKNETGRIRVNYDVSRVQSFYFNKATAQKVTLANLPSKSYPGDGAFTLVNGVWNERGLQKRNEFLGFSGTNLDAVIEMSSLQTIKEVNVGILEAANSWIYRPSAIEVYISEDGSNYKLAGSANQFTMVTPLRKAGVSFQPQQAKFVRVVVKNYGTIPAGNPGAGSAAWLFADEIEIN